MLFVHSCMCTSSTVNVHNYYMNTYRYIALQTHVDIMSRIATFVTGACLINYNNVVTAPHKKYICTVGI